MAGEEVIGMNGKEDEEQIVTVSEEQLSKHGFVCIGDSYEMWKLAEYIFGDKDTPFAWHLLDTHNQYCDICKGKMIQIPGNIEHVEAPKEVVINEHRDQAQNTETEYTQIAERSFGNEREITIELLVPESHHMDFGTSDVNAPDSTGDQQPSNSVEVQVSIAEPVEVESTTGVVVVDDTDHVERTVSMGAPDEAGQEELSIDIGTATNTVYAESSNATVDVANTDTCNEQDIKKEMLAESVDTGTPIADIGIKHDGTLQQSTESTQNGGIEFTKPEPAATPVGAKRRSQRQKQRKKESVHTCGECGLACGNAGLLVTHMRIHTGERPFKCDHCPTAFSRNSELTIHKRIHTGDRPYQCDFCGKTFPKSSALTAHKRTHSGSRPYRCRHCGKTFMQRQHAKSHQLTHSGLKKYQCEVCGRSFGGNSALTRHKYIHTGDVRYQCTECSKSYSRRHELTAHIKRVHDIKNEVDTE